MAIEAAKLKVISANANQLYLSNGLTLNFVPTLFLPTAESLPNRLIHNHTSSYSLNDPIHQLNVARAIEQFEEWQHTIPGHFTRREFLDQAASAVSPIIPVVGLIELVRQLLSTHSSEQSEEHTIPSGNTHHTISRREFLKISAVFVAGSTVLAACAPVTPSVALPTLTVPFTPSPQIPPVLPEMNESDFPTEPRERALKLIQGIFPRNWLEYSNDQLLDTLRKEMLDTILPEYIKAMGGSVSDIDRIKASIHFARTTEQEIKQLIDIEHESLSSATSITQDTLGHTVIAFDNMSTQKQVRIYINEQNILDEAVQSQLRKVESLPENERPLFNSRAFLVYIIIKAYTDVMMHEPTHAFKEKAQYYSDSQSNFLRQIFQERIIYNGNTITPDRIENGVGMSVNIITDGKKVPFYQELGEVYRAYCQDVALGRLIDPSDYSSIKNIYAKREYYRRDVARSLFVYALHQELGISDAEFFRDNQHLELLEIMKYYEKKASEKHIGLNLRNISYILGLIDIYSREYINSQDKLTIDEYQFVQERWQKIRDFIDSNKDLPPLPLPTVLPPATVSPKIPLPAPVPVAPTLAPVNR